MPYKIGGGDHLQFYDEANGQYDEETKRRINEDDKRALGIVYYFNFSADYLVFHWPVEGLHDERYCDMFAKYARNKIKSYEVDIRKCVYFLGYRQYDDKSAFLKAIGYSISDCEKLMHDIKNDTDVKSLTFSRYRKGCFSCAAKTTLNGKIVTTIWELGKDFSIRLITLVPGGDKRWK